MSVTIENYDRGTAEQKYGFKIYQGGVVPVKSVRIVSIEDFDVEACGGTHVKKTKEIELIKITRTKRIQDGVVRIEFVSGPTAQKYVEQQKVKQSEQSEESAQKEIIDTQREENKQKFREKIPILINEILAAKSGEIHGITVKNNFCYTMSDYYDEYFHLNFGKKLVARDDKAAHIGIFESGETTRVIVYAGEQSGVNASEIAKDIASILGGSSGGDAKFAQGGGKDTSKMDMIKTIVNSKVLGL